MKRKAVLFLMVGALLPLGAASTAWACASLATLKMPKNVAPGQTVAVVGTGFSDNHAGTSAGDSKVALRLKTRNGTILRDDVEVRSNRINTTVTMPQNLPPGYYVLLGLQTNKDGVTKAGTPARFAFKVSGAPVAQSVVASPWSSAPSGPSSSASVAGDGGLGSQTLLVGGILSLTLLAAGSVLVGRKNHTMTLGV